MACARVGSPPDMDISLLSRSRSSISRSRSNLSLSNLSLSNFSLSNFSLSNFSLSDMSRWSSYLSTMGRSGLYSPPGAGSSRLGGYMSGCAGLPMSIGREGGG